MTRDKAYHILIKYLTNKNLINHCLACEASMQEIYDHLHQETSEYNPNEKEKWGVTGLLHDADYELAKNHPEQHGLLLFEKEQDIPEDIAYAIKAHNYEHTGFEPKNNMDWAIATVDQLTGLIVAAALIRPDKKLASLTPESVIKRFHEKSFAKGVNRQTISQCEDKLHIKLNEFITITLRAMQKIDSKLGL